MGPFNPDVERIQAEIGPGFSPNFVPPTKWKKLTDNSEIMCFAFIKLVVYEQLITLVDRLDSIL